MTLKTYKTAVRASAVLAAIVMSGGAFGAGAAGDYYMFEAAADTKLSDGAASLAGLTGNGTIVSEVIDPLPAVGRPIAGDDTGRVLEIAGTVAYTNAAADGDITSNASQVDFMFKVEPTDETLETPVAADIQVALAVGVTNNAEGTTAPIQLYCKTTSGGDAGWTTIAENATVGSWVRATLVMDYTDNTCKVSIDGNPALNNGDQKFYFAGTSAQAFVKSITMVGSTRIDDLKVSHDANYAIPGGDTPVPGVPAGSPVTYADLNKYGVTVADAKADNDVSGCNAGKISEKITAGLDPKSPTKFGLKTMTPTAANSATVTFPGSNDSGYTVKVTDAAGVVQSSVAVTSADNTGKTAADEDIKQATVTLPTDKLVYITVEATK